MANANDNIINMQKKFEEKAEQARQQHASMISDRMKEAFAIFENINPDETLSPIVALLQIPEPEFSAFADIFLDEMNRAMTNSSESLLMAQSMNLSGTSLEDLQMGFQHLVIELDKEFKLSDAKKSFLSRFFMIIINAIAETQGVSKKIIRVPVELGEDARVPSYAKPGDAGMDIYSTEEITINPGETKLIHTGVKVAVPRGYELQVRPKSGISLNTKLRVANAPGTIDSGYRDEVCIIIENVDPPIKNITYDFDENGRPIITSIEHGKPYTIAKYSKIAQLVLSELVVATFEKVGNISEVEGEDRGGGFGSTGLN